MNETPRKIKARINRRIPDVNDSGMIRYCPLCGKVIPSNQTICKTCAGAARQSGTAIPPTQLYLLLILLLMLLFALIFGTSSRGEGKIPQGTPVPVTWIDP